jgi:hypothetical protein
LIAGSPCALNSIQLFARRQVLFSCEAPSQGTRQALEAYYADDRQVVVDFCQAHDVDYLVVDLETYSKGYLTRGWIFFEPYNQQLLPYIASRDAFVLTQVPNGSKVFQSENYFVIACDNVE